MGQYREKKMVIFHVLKGRESWMADRLYPVVGNMPRIIIRARPTPCSPLSLKEEK